MSEELFVQDENDQIEVEDEIVAEIPVYLNNRVGSDLLLLQYPTRSRSPVATSASQPDVKMSSIKVKEHSEVIEVELNSEVPSDLINANSSASTNMGISQIYSGTLFKNSGRYAVGYMRNGLLHLSLIPQTTQLRPKFAQNEVTQSSLLPNNSTTDSGHPPALRSVQMSVKSSSTEVPKHSGVLEFWRQSNKEEPKEFVPTETDAERRDNILMLDINGLTPEVKCKDFNSSMVFL